MTNLVHLEPLATHVLSLARTKGVMIATAESCTGGLITGILTEISGSSDVVDRGFVTYTNIAKQEMLGVPEEILATHGAVSPQVARAMAEGALARSKATITVAVTGIAGPGGGSEQKPVGLVHFGLAISGQETLHKERRFGAIGRAQVRAQTVEQALLMLQERLG